MNSPVFDLQAIPAALRPALGAPIEAAGGHAGLAAALAGGGGEAGAVLRLWAASPFAADLAVRHPELLADLLASGRQRRPSAPGELAALAGQLPDAAGDDEFQQALRLFRHRELLRILLRDLNGLAPVAEGLRDLSDLADAAINAALGHVTRVLQARHGEPRGEDGTPCGLGVLSMGKLGGHELNFSSDVDLVFVYSGPGETSGPRPISNEEYFRLVAQRLIDTLSRNTAEGFVYRVDARLRPFGSAGPLAVSLPAFENYLLQHGRDWERYAYVKARVVNAWSDTEYLYRDVLRPFVYRRYLDYGVFGSLREMKALIAAEVEKKEYRTNLKLGPGGIREIEFIVQALQLVRGGTVAALRERQLLVALPALVAAGCLPALDAAGLDASYRFLRAAENRIQAQYDRQTHDLPADPLDQQRLAWAMGHGDWPAFQVALRGHLDTVTRHFHDIVFRGSRAAGEEDEAGRGTGPGNGLGLVWSDTAATAEVQQARLAAAGFADPAAAMEPLRRLREAGLPRRLDEAGRQRLDVLLPATLRAAARQTDPVQALEGMVKIIESIGRRSAYFVLLTENPAALERLVNLCATSGFLSRLVASHPLLLDELLDPRVFEAAPTRDELRADLEARLARVADDDTEGSLEALRNFQQAAIFRVAIVDLAGVLPLMKVSDRLTDIAELVLEGALGIAWRELADRHGQPRCRSAGMHRPAGFAIVAYGKLGGLELGYGSDLDLVFLHDSEGDEQQTDGPQPLENTVFFARLTRRIIGVLTMHASSGKLYEVDIRLRPSGASGLMVSSLAAFDRYQRQDAWTWEHQALLRSRAVAGDAGVKSAFETLRVRALREYIRRDSLATEVAEMRQRMREELSRGTGELFDLKQDPGGIADIEFLVQYLVLRDARQYPDLVRWSDNIRQLEGLATHGLLQPADADFLASTYRDYRQRIHHRSLAGQGALVPRAEVEQLAAGVVQRWQAVFYTAAPRTP